MRGQGRGRVQLTKPKDSGSINGRREGRRRERRKRGSGTSK